MVVLKFIVIIFILSNWMWRETVNTPGELLVIFTRHVVGLTFSVVEPTKGTKFSFPVCDQKFYLCFWAVSLTWVGKKVKCTLLQALRLCTVRTAYRGSRGIALPFHDDGTRRVEGSASRSGRSLPQGKTRYPFYRSLGGPQGRSGQVRKISPTTGFDPRVVQPVFSRYTDYAIQPTNLVWVTRNRIIWSVCVEEWIKFCERKETVPLLN
jgi:hypothetical protein